MQSQTNPLHAELSDLSNTSGSKRGSGGASGGGSGGGSGSGSGGGSGSRDDDDSVGNGGGVGQGGSGSGSGSDSDQEYLDVVAAMTPSASNREAHEQNMWDPKRKFRFHL